MPGAWGGQVAQRGHPKPISTLDSQPGGRGVGRWGLDSGLAPFSQSQCGFATVLEIRQVLARPSGGPGRMRGDGAGLGAALHHQRWLNPFWYGRWVPLARGLGSPCPRPPLEKEDGADNPSVAFPTLFFWFVLRSDVQRAAQVKHSRAKDLHSPSLLLSAGSHSTSTPRRA